MEFKIGRSYTTLCPGNDCKVTGFVLITMKAPEGYEGLITDTVTNKSYPRNHVFQIPIDPDTESWESCPLPASDQLSPTTYYSVAEIIAGSGGCDCACQAGDCGCANLCSEDVPTCDLFLSSTSQSLIPAESGTNNISGLCTNAPTTTRCDYFNEVFSGCVPQRLAVDMGLMYLASGPEVMPWYMPADGSVKFSSIATLLGGNEHSSDMYFEIYRTDTNTILLGDFIPQGSTYKELPTTTFDLDKGVGIAWRVVGPLPTTLATGANIQMLVDLDATVQ